MAWIAAGAAIGGAAISYMGNKKSNESNQGLNRKNREWQEKMRATQYQTAVADLRAAGLNPMLAYSQGGAGTPTPTSIPMQNEMSGAGDAVNSAGSLYRARAEVENMRAQNAQINAGTQAALAAAEKSRSDTAVNQAMIPKIQADVVGSVNSAAYTAAQTRVSDVMVPKILAETENIKDDNARINASVKKLIEETKNVPLTGDQIRHAVDLLIIQAKGGDLQNMLRMTELPKAMNQEEAQKSWWMRNISPYLPDVSTVLHGAGSAKSLAK